MGKVIDFILSTILVVILGVVVFFGGMCVTIRWEANKLTKEYEAAVEETINPLKVITLKAEYTNRMNELKQREKDLWNMLPFELDLG